MKIQRAVITAAAPHQRTLPLQTLIDRDGRPKSALSIICGEALDAGVEALCVVVHPGDHSTYAESIGESASRVTFVEQAEPRGYGDALLCAREFAAGEPFLHLVSDHVYVSPGGTSCARLLVERAEAEHAAVSAVQPTRETKLPFFGAVGARRVSGKDDLWEVQRVVEKPTPTQAEQDLLVPGLRAGHYLCFFGMHVLSTGFFDRLAARVEDGTTPPDAHFSGALSDLADRERVLAHQLPGLRYDLGVPYGVFTAQLAIGLEGQDRDHVMTQVLEVLAQRQLSHS